MNLSKYWGTGKLAALQDWPPEWGSVCSLYYVLSSSDAWDRCTPWQGSQEARDYVRARLAGIIQADLSTFDVQKYRRHGTGHGRTYRLRGSVTQRGRVLFTGTNKDHARTKAGRQNDTALISTAAATVLWESGENAVWLDSTASGQLRDEASGRAGAGGAAATFLSMRLCCRSAASHARLLARSGAAA